MSKTSSGMHADFPVWHASVSVGSDVAGRDRRWASVDTLAQGADRDLVEALARLAFAHAKQPPQPTALKRIHEAFRDEDDTFDARRADREMQVYAGACLQVVFDGSADLACAAALSVTTAAFSGTRSPSLPVDLVGKAEEALVRLADDTRRRPSLVVSREPPKLDVTAALAKVSTATDLGAVQQALTSLADAVRVGMATLALRQSQIVSAIDGVLRVQDEELQVLWWLTNGRSLDLDRAFDAVPAEVQPLLLAKELSDHTTSLPGPRSLKALLLRAGLRERKRLTVATTVNAADATWKSTLVDGAHSPLTTPIHFAIARHMETGDAESWVANWSAVTGMDASRQFSPMALAVQFYRERLLLVFE